MLTSAKRNAILNFVAEEHIPQQHEIRKNFKKIKKVVDKANGIWYFK